jgi:3-hydroxyacyl-[acyl-carrier-protein] dehydratase
VSVMETKEVMRWLAHRAPFLLVDRVLELDAGKHIVALKNVTFNEPFFPGHFPSNPVMPGVLLLEAMAQAAAILVCKTRSVNPQDFLTYFAGIDEARFKRPVVPGDQLILDVTLLRSLRGIYKFNAKALVADEVAAEAVLLSAVRPV